MKLLLLGGTGPGGVVLCRHALQAGHKLVIYARNPSKLPKDVATHDDVRVVTGQLTDLAAVSAALEGCDVVVSALGPLPTRQKEPAMISNCYKVVFEAMRVKGVKRIIGLATVSVPDPADSAGILVRLLRLLVRTLVPGSYHDILTLGALFAQADDLDWTLVRVPLLTYKPGTAVFAGYIGDRRLGLVLRREALARFVIDELEKGEWVRRMPAISNA